MTIPAPFEITDADDRRIASNGEQTLQLLEGDGRMFRRRAVKNLTQPCEWAVAEVNGVFVYFDGRHVVVTRRDMLP